MNRHPPGLNRTAHPFPTRRSSDLRNEGAPPGEPPGEPIGERIAVSGRVLDEAGRPQPHTLVEVWQANAAGRYVHKTDQHDAPLDPNFFGGGRCVTAAEGVYRFLTVKPGAYPWGNRTAEGRGGQVWVRQGR